MQLNMAFTLKRKVFHTFAEPDLWTELSNNSYQFSSTSVWAGVAAPVVLCGYRSLLQDVLMLIQDLHKSPNLRQLGVLRVKDRFARPPWPADPIEQRKYIETCKGIWKRIVLSLEQLTWIGQIEIDNPFGRSFRRWHFASHICLQQGNYFTRLLIVCAKGLPVL